MSPFAVGHNTGFPFSLGIVENILKAQGVGSRGVFVIVHGIDKLLIRLHGITHQTDITLKSHTPERGVVTRTSGNA